MSRSRAIVIALLSAWSLLLLVTHRGSRSPYTYIPEMTSTVRRIVNPDALLAAAPVTRFFYDGSAPVNWSRADNMKLPFHSFSAATAGAFVRPYLAANDVANFVFVVVLIIAAMRLASREGISDRAMLLALATLLALPAFVVYLGQPLHYVVGPVINYLVILTALALRDEDLRNPWISGALTAILVLNYDWYVFGAALIVYVLAVLRFHSKRDDLIYLAVSFAPVAVWRTFLHYFTAGTESTIVRDAFIHTILVQWNDLFFSDPARNILTPFLATDIGVRIGVAEILALIYWPVVAVGVAAAWNSGVRKSRLLVLLLVMFALEQLAAGAFDVENNPRRAFPVVLAFGCLYCYAAGRRIGSRVWLALFLAAFAVTSFLAFADVILGKPGASYLQIGESVHGEAKRSLDFAATELTIGTAVDPTQTSMLDAFPRARLQHVAAFAFAQAFVGAWLYVLFRLLRRAELMPRYAPTAFLAVWALSAVRFL